MSNKEKCSECGQQAKKRGWNNAHFCSLRCEIIGISQLHGSMPGCLGNWLPSHVRREIHNRWEDS